VRSAPFLWDLVILEECPALRHIEAMRGIEKFVETVPQEHHLLLGVTAVVEPAGVSTNGILAGHEFSLPASPRCKNRQSKTGPGDGSR
jgi:hypothetical protein